MKAKFKKITGLRRSAFGVAALAIGTATILPAFAGQASADQVSSRAIRLSSSNSGVTSVNHQITFNTALAGPVQGVVVDYCANSPLPGTACTAPTGFTVGAGTTTGTVTGMTGTWSGASANAGRTLQLTLATPGGTASAGAAASFTLTTGTNPTNVNTTFFARIFTFSTAAAVATWTAAAANGSSLVGVVDSGGVAMSTAAQINLTAKVQETISFCVYTAATCGGGGTAVALGDTNGVLSSTGHYVDKTAKYDIATNASSGAIIRFKAPLPTSGANTIASFGTAATAPSTAGASQFGLCTFQATGSGLVPDVPYNSSGTPANCAATTQSAGTGTPGGTGTATFAFDTAVAASTFGDDLSTKAAGPVSQGIITFAGFANITQAAGIYTNDFTFIATGTY